MCRIRKNWPGYYMDANGKVISEQEFMAQTKARLDAASEKDRKRRDFFMDK
jgi:hypothetical protein